MKSSTQRTTGPSLDSQTVVRATFDWWLSLHEISLGNDDPASPDDEHGGW